MRYMHMIYLRCNAFSEAIMQKIAGPLSLDRAQGTLLDIPRTIRKYNRSFSKTSIKLQKSAFGTSES